MNFIRSADVNQVTSRISEKILGRADNLILVFESHWLIEYRLTELGSRDGRVDRYVKDKSNNDAECC